MEGRQGGLASSEMLALEETWHVRMWNKCVLERSSQRRARGGIMAEKMALNRRHRGISSMCGWSTELARQAPISRWIGLDGYWSGWQIEGKQLNMAPTKMDDTSNFAVRACATCLRWQRPSQLTARVYQLRICLLFPVLLSVVSSSSLKQAS